MIDKNEFSTSSALSSTFYWWAQPTSRRSISLTLRLLVFPNCWIHELQKLFDLGSGLSCDIWGILLTVGGVFPSTHKKHMSQCHQNACLWRDTTNKIRKFRTGLHEVGGNVECTSQSLTRCTGPLQVWFVIKQNNCNLSFLMLIINSHHYHRHHRQVITDSQDLTFAASKDQLEKMCPWVYKSK